MSRQVAANTVESIEANELFDSIPVEWIVPSPTNPRKHFSPAYIDELAKSIADKGLIHAIVVRPVHPAGKEFVRYEIVAGECRWRASVVAERKKIRAVIREYSDEQVLEIQLIENIHRKDLTPLEQAAGYRALIDSNPDKHSAETIAARVGMSPAWVWDRLSLNSLIPEAKTLLADERITIGHAVLIARQKPEDQERIVHVPEDGLDGYNRQREGLWQFDGAGLPYDADAPENAKRKPGKYDDLKPVSIRELEHWINDHIRFDVHHAAKVQPLQFEAVEERVKQAAADIARGKKVVAITHEYRVADDARDEKERTYGSQAWERADGQFKSKTCEYSVLGVVVAGRDRGDSFAICVNRDKCLVHWKESVKAKEKATELRAKGKTKQAGKVEKRAEVKEEQQWEREQREEKAREAEWAAIEKAVIGESVDQVRRVKTLTAAHAKAIEAFGGEIGLDDIRKHLGAGWFKTPAAALLVSMVTYFSYAGWKTKLSGFDTFVRDIGKPLKLDLKRLEAIRDKHAPKADQPASAKAQSR